MGSASSRPAQFALLGLGRVSNAVNFAQLGSANIRALARARSADLLTLSVAVAVTSAWFRATQLVRKPIGQTRPERGRFRNASRNRARAPAPYVKLLRRTSLRSSRNSVASFGRRRSTALRDRTAGRQRPRQRTPPAACRLRLGPARNPAGPSAETRSADVCNPTFQRPSCRSTYREEHRTPSGPTRRNDTYSGAPCRRAPDPAPRGATHSGGDTKSRLEWSRSGRAAPRACARVDPSVPSAVRRPYDKGLPARMPAAPPYDPDAWRTHLARTSRAHQTSGASLPPRARAFAGAS